MSESFDAARFKRIERDGYNLIAGRYAAAAAARDALNRALVDRAALSSGLRVLDLASGPGTLALAARERVGAAGWIVASDLAESALAAARTNAGLDGAAADAEALPFASGAFDRVLCGLGLMFFPSEALAPAEMLRVLKPGGRLALSVWGRHDEVPLVACALDCMARLLPAPRVARPSVFRFGDSDKLAQTLAAAGFADVAIEPFTLRLAFPDASAYWQAFLDLAGGAAWSLGQLPAGRQAALRQAVAEDLAPWRDAGGYTLESRVLLAAGRRP